jgi:hypothetical protein
MARHKSMDTTLVYVHECGGWRTRRRTRSPIGRTPRGESEAGEARAHGEPEQNSYRPHHWGR